MQWEKECSPDLDPGEITKFWEIECIELDQITEVQGHLKLNIAFWREVLHAPPPVLDCIEFGSRLTIVSLEAKKKQRTLSELFTWTTTKKLGNAQAKPP